MGYPHLWIFLPVTVCLCEPMCSGCRQRAARLLASPRRDWGAGGCGARRPGGAAPPRFYIHPATPTRRRSPPLSGPLSPVTQTREKFTRPDTLAASRTQHTLLGLLDDRPFHININNINERFIRPEQDIFP